MIIILKPKLSIAHLSGFYTKANVHTQITKHLKSVDSR